MKIAQKAFIDVVFGKGIHLACRNDNTLMLVDGIRTTADRDIGFARCEIDQRVCSRAGRRNRKFDEPDQVLHLHHKKFPIVMLEKML